MKNWILLLSLLISTPSFAFGILDDLHPLASHEEAFLEAEISEGVLYTVTGPGSRVAEIRAQLNYTIGQLHELSGTAQVSKLKVTPLTVAMVPNGNGLKRITYRASFTIAWSKAQQPLPPTFEFVLPARGDLAGLKRFMDQYRLLCHDGDPSDATLNNYWYHFRTDNPECQLRSRATPETLKTEQGIVVRNRAQLRGSPLQTTGKSPEYARMWADGKLTATVVFAKNKEGTKTDDVGIYAYDELYTSLLESFGPPTRQSVQFEGYPGNAVRELVLEFQLPQGPFEIALFLIDGVRAEPASFAEKFGRRARVSDLVIYSGHAGLGANIRALSKMAQTEKGRYTLYFMNGCNTFAYLTRPFFELHERANPGQPGTRFADVISNAMPAYFSSMANATLQILEAARDQKKTYEEILAGLDSYQRAVVDGEEDNP